MPHTNNYSPRPVNPVPSGRKNVVCLLVSNMPLVQTFSSRVTSLLDNLCVFSLPASWLATPVQLKVLINLHACFPSTLFCALTWSQPNKHLLQGLRSSCPTALWEARTVWEERFMSLRQEFSIVAQLTYWARSFFVVEGCPIRCRMLTH